MEHFYQAMAGVGTVLSSKHKAQRERDRRLRDVCNAIEAEDLGTPLPVLEKLSDIWVKFSGRWS